jgi:hypothetical protein
MTLEFKDDADLYDYPELSKDYWGGTLIDGSDTSEKPAIRFDAELFWTVFGVLTVLALAVGMFLEIHA